MKLRTILFATAALFAIPAAVTHADDGLRMLPTALLQLANTWTKAQNMPGIDVTGQQQGFGGTTDGCHLTYSGGTGNITCLYQGVGWRALNVDALTEVHGSQFPSEAVTFQGSGGFSVLNSPQTMSKLSAAPTTAPGAGKTTLFFVAGTNSGTCKLQALAGTSTTPVTVVDNIGSGC